MEIKNKKSAWAALATLGVTAVAAGATAIVKIREKRKERRALEVQQEEQNTHLSAEQMMVYNEAIRSFLSLNDRIYELRQERDTLQPLVRWLATNSEKPELITDNAEIQQLADNIERFLLTQVPFINACLVSVGDPTMSYADYIRGAVDGTFDDTLDEEPTGAKVAQGQQIAYVLRLGYYFPESRLAPNPVKAIVLV